VALESYDITLSITVRDAPDRRIPGTQGSVECAQKRVFLVFELSRSNQRSVVIVLGFVGKLESCEAF